MKLTLSIIFTFIGIFTFAQGNITDKFEYKFHPNDEVPLPYRFFVPENNDSKIDYPLILTLHGSGERGTDNEMQIKLNHIATVWADSLFQLNHPCYIVSPQCPSQSYWGEDAAMNSVYEILDSIISVCNIDTNRVYITGLSMGGYGTWAALTQRPNMFAAAMPVCGSWSPEAVPLFTHVPIWNHHGGNDNVVPVQDSRDLMKKYEELGIPVVAPNCYNFVCKETSKEEKQGYIDNNVDYLYSEYYGVGHDSWNRAYTDSLAREWLFSKTKRTNSLISIKNKGNYELLANNYTIHLENYINSGYQELLFSNDLGYTWQKIDSTQLIMDSLVINTKILPESAFGMFKVQQVSNTLVTGTDFSSYKRIDNEENGIPILRYGLNKKLSTVNDDELAINFLVGDPEDEQLTLNIYFKPEPDSLYQFVTSFNMQTLPEYQEQVITMNNLPYGIKSKLKFELTDGEHTVIDSTKTFKNNHNNPAAIDLASNEQAFIYPNPSKGKFMVQLNDYTSKTEIEVYNISGQIVHSEYISSNKTYIDLKGVQKGIYLIKVKNNLKSFNKRIVID